MNYLTDGSAIPAPGLAQVLEIRLRDMDIVGPWRLVHKVALWQIPPMGAPPVHDTPIMWAVDPDDNVQFWPPPRRLFEVRIFDAVAIGRMQKAWLGSTPMADPSLPADEGTREAKPVRIQDIIDATEPMRKRAEASMEAARKRWGGYSDDGMPGGAEIPIVVKTEDPEKSRADFLTLEGALNWAAVYNWDVRLVRSAGRWIGVVYLPAKTTAHRTWSGEKLDDFRQWLILQVESFLAEKPKPPQVDHEALVQQLKRGAEIPSGLGLDYGQIVYILAHLDPAPPK